MIPTAHAEPGDPARLAHQLEESATDCALNYEGGPGMGGWGPFGEGSSGSTPIALRSGLRLLAEHR